MKDNRSKRPITNEKRQEMGESEEEKRKISFGLLEDNMGELDIIDTRKFSAKTNNSKEKYIIEDLPSKITGSYNEDYNIIYVDTIIRKKLQQEKFTHLISLKNRLKTLDKIAVQPQTFLMRKRTLDNIEKIKSDIFQIESGERLRIYNLRVQDILKKYRQYSGKVKTIFLMNRRK